ncbi:hypothetical protein [Paenimyroides aestuarii]|uniref:Uncharacterized protein n=1 Tax=Paenimyroides aestuarii TaxID=2968490 RepID=A0ABY5NT07_9FLAO|nr:hypothetical protein [Paenimyroides aestuarii]UUV21713.1 hypothetical protein NPX36_01280 [Paenimyroides aestuarii]
MYTKKAITLYLFAIFCLLFSVDGIAQCAMCRAALETEETGMKAEAVNDGIVYLMAFPYLLLLVGGIVIYRIMKGKKKNKA